MERDCAGRYFASFVVAFNPKPLPLTAKAVGIDLGLNDIFVASDGFKSGNPRHLKRLEATLQCVDKDEDLVEIGISFPEASLLADQKWVRNAYCFLAPAGLNHPKAIKGRRWIVQGPPTVATPPDWAPSLSPTQSGVLQPMLTQDFPLVDD